MKTMVASFALALLGISSLANADIYPGISGRLSADKVLTDIMTLQKGKVKMSDFEIKATITPDCSTGIASVIVQVQEDGSFTIPAINYEFDQASASHDCESDGVSLGYQFRVAPAGWFQEALNPPRELENLRRDGGIAYTRDNIPTAEQTLSALRSQGLVVP